jgi:hypothetical protein
VARVKVHIDTLRSLDWPWPPHPLVRADSVGADGMIDLAAVTAWLEANLAFYKREQDEMYAFASRWNADIDDITDRRDEIADGVRNGQEAIALVREIADAVAAIPPRKRTPRRPG